MIVMSEPTKKVWGWSTRVLFIEGQVQVERIYIKPGGYSSIHEHRHKANQFIVIAGQLKVNLFDGQNKLEESTLIGPGDVEIVYPPHRHQFVATTEVDGFEVYWIPDKGRLDPDDITRYSDGGLDGEWLNGPPWQPDGFRHCHRCSVAYRANELSTIVADAAIRDVCNQCLRTEHQI
jgi:quercetin dioxygenase-like cupin family protein